MKLKKNPKADLTNRSGLFFAIGLALASGLTWWAIELKSNNDKGDFAHVMDVDQGLDEDVEAIVMPDAPPPPPPPPPPPAPVEIEVVDNKKEIDQDIFQSSEMQKDQATPDVPDIAEPIDEPVVDVPFAVIEDKPMFDACKDQPKAKQFDCFKENLDKHVQKNFRYPEMALEMGIQGRVYVNFRINKDGSITVIGTRGPDKSLEAEARRIIEKLPKLIPGKQRGKPTPVTFAYPITFKLNT